MGEASYVQLFWYAGYYGATFFLSFLITVYLIPHCIGMAYAIGLLDRPDRRLKTQATPVPYLGGLAIYSGFLSGILLAVPCDTQVYLLIGGATFLLLIGLIDDLCPLRPYQKLCGQLLAVLFFVKVGLYLKEQFFLNHGYSIILSFFWLLTIINGVNLIDVMDGLAALCAGMSLIGLWLVAFGMGQHTLALAIICLIAAIFGFWRYNKPPASLYMGDAGSLCIGGFLAAFPFTVAWATYEPLGFLAAPVFLWAPLMEVVGLVVVRTWYGIPFYQGSRHHMVHYLQKRGWRPPAILFLFFMVSSFLNAISLFYVFKYIDLEMFLGLSASSLVLWIFFIYS